MEKHTISESYKQTEVGMIPEGWDSVSIGELITDLRGGAPFKPSDFTKYGVKVLPKGGVIRGGRLRILEKDQQYCSPSFASKYTKNQVNEKYTVVVLRDLVPSGPSIGLMVKIPAPDDYVLAQGVYGFLTKDQSVSAYLIQYSNTNRYRRAANEVMVGSTQVHITNGAFKEIKIALPSTVKEQTAIANALSDVDALIAGLEKLIAKKLAIKTATMQQLLTGRTRLPEFANHPDGTPKGYKQSELGEIPEDWERSLIGSVLKITTGSKNTQDKVAEGQYPFFVRSQNVERINSYSFDGEGVLTAGDGVGTGKIFHYINGKCDIHQRVYVMHDFDECLDGYYFYVFFSEHFYDRIMSMTAKSSVDSVRREMISEMPIILPPKAEQSKIANILSDMDEEIQSLQHRLVKTRQIKQGMMQELLTGKTRLV